MRLLLQYFSSCERKNSSTRAAVEFVDKAALLDFFQNTRVHHARRFHVASVGMRQGIEHALDAVWFGQGKLADALERAFVNILLHERVFNIFQFERGEN